MDRDKILLTPGPLTTTLRTKLAMLKDWGSWDADFNALTASVRHRLQRRSRCANAGWRRALKPCWHLRDFRFCLRQRMGRAELTSG